VKPGIVISFVGSALCHTVLLFGFRLQDQAHPLPTNPEPSTVDVDLVEGEPAASEPDAAPSEPAPAPSATPEPESTASPMETPTAAAEAAPTPTPALESIPTATPIPAADSTPKSTHVLSEASNPKHQPEQTPAPIKTASNPKTPIYHSAAKQVHAVPTHNALGTAAAYPRNTKSQGAAGTSGGTSAKPRYRSNPAPEYPATARVNHEQGVVMVSVDVSKEGRPTAISLGRSCGFPDLDQAALQAVRHWLFDPALSAGVPIASHVEVPVRFSLR
jgi:protein TonB